MFTKKYKGFTLIELLVVIAIIGILSSIVLVSVNTARNKAKDARIQANLSQLRSAAELVYSTNGSGYTGLATDASVVTLSNDITAQGGTLTITLKTDASNTAYCASSPLVSAASRWGCVDSSGNAKWNLTVAPASCAAGADPKCP